MSLSEIRYHLKISNNALHKLPNDSKFDEICRQFNDSIPVTLALPIFGIKHRIQLISGYYVHDEARISVLIKLGERQSSSNLRRRIASYITDDRKHCKLTNVSSQRSLMQEYHGC